MMRFSARVVGRPAIWRRSLRGWVANLCEYEDFRYFIHKVCSFVVEIRATVPLPGGGRRA